VPGTDVGRRVAVFDAPSGASGDMVLAALVDAGAPLDAVTAALRRAGLEAVELVPSRVERGGTRALRLDVRGAPESGLGPRDIARLIESAGLPPRARERALAALSRLEEAEAAVHGSGHAHFHELGGVDTAVDLIGAALAFELLGVEAAACPVVTVGAGAVAQSAHGPLPASPPPAAAEVLLRARFRLRFVEAPVELVTPTGAALLAALAEPRDAAIVPGRAGIGAGTRDLAGRPNVLRVFIGEEAEEPETRTLTLLEANIDDMTPAALAAARDALLAAGALDAWFEPIAMKKGRPAQKLCVLAPAGQEPRFADLILRETTTLGVRFTTYRRFEAERWSETVPTPYGPIRVKASRWGDRVRRVPEFDDVASLARSLGRPFLDLYEALSREVGRLP
jgi:uncharacterized protein (TIGR00299 family) protein